MHRRASPTLDATSLDASAWGWRGRVVPSVRRAPEAGFTLIELMVVITLIALLATMMVPDIASGRDEANQRSTVRNLVALLRLARSEAITKGRDHRLVLRPSASAAWLEWRSDRPESDGEFEPVTTIRLGEDYVESTRDESVRIPPNALTWADSLECGVRPIDPIPFDTTEPPPPPPVRPDEDPQVGDAFAIYFRPDGTSDARQILVIDRTGYTLAVNVDPVTAEVRVKALGRDRSGPGRAR
ncbi:MAG: GspH/FimT family pseudopilin [Planctomycetota bacterium]